ncbi:uncharacterized protein LOC136075714 [Hydra vulgaris]|uniref:Uncharacterized protein LOC136075714 n=1 Tax=Hydra vulgaris TaxID=6087 RepID=A0ABM4B8M2_HYDVU
MPSEFASQPQSLQNLDPWKTTEFRQFLIYLGPVVLKGVVSEQVYEHFLLLSISIGIMLTSNDQFCNNHLEYARIMTTHFVYSYKYIFVETFTVYNVHSLLHLVDEIKITIAAHSTVSLVFHLKIFYKD